MCRDAFEDIREQSVTLLHTWDLGIEPELSRLSASPFAL